MFIKLTRLDGQPIWINASFLVTVEPRKQGGATVVPIGDGLDYDVKESPEHVLELASGAPEPSIVPVPTSDALTPTPADVSPEPDPEPARVPRADPEPTKKPSRSRTRKTKKVAQPVETAPAEDRDARLKKMAPRSVKRLLNVLSTQFKVADPDAALKDLVARGVVQIEQDHIHWN